MKWIKKEETCRQFVQVRCPKKKAISRQNDSPSHVPLGRKGTTSQEKGKRGLSSLKEQLPYGQKGPISRGAISLEEKRTKLPWKKNLVQGVSFFIVIFPKLTGVQLSLLVALLHLRFQHTS